MLDRELNEIYDKLGKERDEKLALDYNCSKSYINYYRLIKEHAIKGDREYLIKNLKGHGRQVRFVCNKLGLDLYGKVPSMTELLNNEIAELEKQLEEKKKALEEAKKPKVWKPKNGDKYYFITSCGNILTYIWDNCGGDNDRYAIGNCFKTQEEAEFEVEKLKVIAELKRFAEEHNTASIDWNISNQFRYYIYYDYFTKLVGYYWANMCRRNDIYFSSKELAQQAVKQIGEDRVKKYYLGVEE